MSDWLDGVLGHGGPPEDIEGELARAGFVSGVHATAAFGRLVELALDAFGPRSSMALDAVTWSGEGPGMRWYACRNRLAESPFYRWVLSAVDPAAAAEDVVAEPLPGGIFGLRAELAMLVVNEKLYTTNEPVIGGLGNEVDDVVSAWWRELTDGRPEDFLAHVVEDAWSPWFGAEDEYRFAGTWVALDRRLQRAYVVRVALPVDDW